MPKYLHHNNDLAIVKFFKSLARSGLDKNQSNKRDAKECGSLQVNLSLFNQVWNQEVAFHCFLPLLPCSLKPV